jgi:23S rRNA pseudouridine955/2504/2580 synthase
MKNIPLLFENDLCFIFNKPAGLPVQGGQQVRVSLDSLLAQEYSPAPLLVHRLDKETSGCILVAKHQNAAKLFTHLLSSATPRAIIKQYKAICASRPVSDTGIIDNDLTVHGSVKQSETRYKLIASNGDYSLLELEPGTGRMHQIRRHLSFVGTPVLGDDKYGNFPLNRELRLKHLLLHATRIAIPDMAIDVTAEPPEYFTTFLQRFFL